MAKKKYSSPRNKKIPLPPKLDELQDKLKKRGNQIIKNDGAGTRESSYNRLTLKKIYQLALLGMSNEEIAFQCDVTYSTFMEWCNADHPNFRPELKTTLFDSREGADAVIADRLYARARGYRHKETKFFMNNKGKIVSVDTIKQYPPDVNAATYILNNKRNKTWRHRPEGEQGIPPGGTTIVNVITEPDKIAQLMKDANEKQKNQTGAPTAQPPTEDKE